MIKLLTKTLIWFCEKTGRILKITGTSGPEDVYLVRYFVIRSKYFNFFIHRFLRSDRDDLHDHPWNFITYLVDGAYKERKWNPETGEIDVNVRWNFRSKFASHKMNRLIFRKATDQHQVVLYSELKPHQIAEAILTICVTGPTKREWGFIKTEPAYSDGKDGSTPGSTIVKYNRHWIPWRTYLNLPEDMPGRG